MEKICVIGIGNPLRQDDGIGIILLEKLIERKKELTKNIELVDGGTGGMNLLHTISRFDTIVFLDAVNFNGNAGESRFLKFEDIKRKNKVKCNSTHSLDIIKIIEIMKELEKKPKKVYIFCIQPKDTSFGKNLSKELSEKFDSIFDNLIINLKKILLGNPNP